MDGGKGYQFGNDQISVWFDGTGLKIGRGKTALFATDCAIINWEQAAERVKQLYDAGLYVNHDVLEEVDLQQRAGRILRQGNKNEEVQIFRYATSQTFVLLWNGSFSTTIILMAANPLVVKVFGVSGR